MSLNNLDAKSGQPAEIPKEIFIAIARGAHPAALAGSCGIATARTAASRAICTMECEAH
jgi:hypothetical protein